MKRLHFLRRLYEKWLVTVGLLWAVAAQRPVVSMCYNP
jgi:hypothetical protein